MDRSGSTDTSFMTSSGAFQTDASCGELQRSASCATTSGAGAPTAAQQQQQRQQARGGGRAQPHIHHSQLPTSAPVDPAAASATSWEWLYKLVTFPSYFTPCPSCCGGNRTPKREQLVTHFDTTHPNGVYCSHCPEHKTRAAGLLQVRRSAFKDVVKAVDVCRFGADIGGVQQYTLNGSKVIYLSREATTEKKGGGASTAPATCAYDGRAMMDKTSTYCSLRCKLCGEDPRFMAWLERQDPALLAASLAAANAPPRPTLANKRTAPGDQGPTCSGGSAGNAVCGGGARVKKAARREASFSATSASSGGDGAAGDGTAAQAVAAARTMGLSVLVGDAVAGSAATTPHGSDSSSPSHFSLGGGGGMGLAPIKTGRGPQQQQQSALPQLARSYSHTALAGGPAAGAPTAEPLLGGSGGAAAHMQRAFSVGANLHAVTNGAAGSLHGAAASAAGDLHSAFSSTLPVSWGGFAAPAAPHPGAAVTTAWQVATSPLGLGGDLDDVGDWCVPDVASGGLSPTLGAGGSSGCSSGGDWWLGGSPGGGPFDAAAMGFDDPMLESDGSADGVLLPSWGDDKAGGMLGGLQDLFGPSPAAALAAKAEQQDPWGALAAVTGGH